MKILLSCNNLVRFSGSECMVLDFAEELKAQGHEVIIITNEYNYPIKSCFNGVSVYIGVLPEKYHSSIDLVIAFQSFTLKPLLKSGLHPKKIIYFSLGPSEPFETPPIPNENIFSLGFFNSQESLVHHIENSNVTKEQSFVFPNSVKECFFNSDRVSSKKLQKIAVVTNHSNLLHEDIKKSLSEVDISVSFFGRTKSGVSRLVTPQLLSGFDLVITMGRTVQYCMALGVPVYLYDKFGGCGYLSEQNYLEEEWFNYSGRGSRRELSADDIVDEIKSGFDNYNVNFFKTLAKNKYSLKNNIVKLLEQVKTTPPYSPKLAASFYHDAPVYEKLVRQNLDLKRKVKNLVEKVNFNNTFEDTVYNEMKLSISFNFFNGEEYFYQNIFNMRKVADHISIVYQDVSNHGNKMSFKAKNILNKIIQNGLVDDVHMYEPDLLISPSENEFKKRRLGERIARNNSCTHFLIMDSDEFYERRQFKAVKNYILKHNITYSSCPSYFYLKKPIYRSSITDKTNVSFICKLDSNTEFKRGGYFPVENVDPTRRVINTKGNFKFFDEKTVVMHHMNFIRADNFKSKLENSSNAHKVEFMNKLLRELQNWKFGNTFEFPNKGTFNIIEVENMFNLPNVNF